MNTWHSRVTEAREGARLSKAEFARLVGVSGAAVTDWESGAIKSLSAEKLLAIARVTHKPPEWLLTGRDLEKTQKVPESLLPRTPSEEDYVLIPQYNVKGSCGNGHWNDHVEVKGELAFKRKWLKEYGITYEQAQVIYASGDSMSPTIEDHAVVLIDVSKTEPRNGKVFALLLDDEVRIKRLFKSTRGEWRLASDSSNKMLYPDEPVDLDHVGIIGQCVWQGGGL